MRNGSKNECRPVSYILQSINDLRANMERKWTRICCRLRSKKVKMLKKSKIRIFYPLKNSKVLKLEVKI